MYFDMCPQSVCLSQVSPLVTLNKNVCVCVCVCVCERERERERDRERERGGVKGGGGILLGDGGWEERVEFRRMI